MVYGSGGQVSLYEEIYNSLQSCQLDNSGHFNPEAMSGALVDFDINMRDPHPRSDGCSLLHVAVGLGGCSHCIRQLLTLGAAPYLPSRGSSSDEPRSAIGLARSLGYEKAAQYMEDFFVQKVADCIQQGDAIELLDMITINSQGDVGISVSYDGTTMSFLHFDVLCNGPTKNTACAKVLLDAGLSPHCTDSFGLTCISYAKTQSSFAHIRLYKKYIT